MGNLHKGNDKTYCYKLVAHSSHTVNRCLDRRVRFLGSNYRQKIGFILIEYRNKIHSSCHYPFSLPEKIFVIILLKDHFSFRIFLGSLVWERATSTLWQRKALICYFRNKLNILITVLSESTHFQFSAFNFRNTFTA